MLPSLKGLNRAPRDEQNLVRQNELVMEVQSGVMRGLGRMGGGREH